jgi:aspartyl-tRNA(Asn)/glutamyl-tRNA(Gln) amidotransferase subunit B
MLSFATPNQEDMKENYTLVVGLEVHAQLLTSSKAYSSDSTEYGNLPNTNISVITLAHPGTLPKANEKVVEYAIKMGLACGAEITRYNYYDRKNYFYPDLPKGYQITQDKTPICRGGGIKIKLKDGREKYINLTRIHMEEDAGKSMHLPGSEESLIDLNRAGVPLIEIVSEPDIRHSEEAYAYLTEIRKLLRYLEICDGNMEEGSLRCDANISVMPKGSNTFGKKVEVKNMNSFRNVQRAIEYEMERQVNLIESGQEVVSETRMFDATTGETYSLRTKESLNDYRYFPEPDLQPVIITDQYLNDIKSALPALPNELLERFMQQFGLPEYDALVLTESKEIALYFDKICKLTTNYKQASNWMMGPVKSYLNELTLHISDFPLKPDDIADLIALVQSNKVSNSAAAQEIFPKMITTGKKAETLAYELNLIQESNEDALIPVIKQVLASYPDKVEEYKNGKKGLMGLFMGEVRKATQGKADPKVATRLISEILEA